MNVGRSPLLGVGGMGGSPSINIMYRGLQAHKPLPKNLLQYVQGSFKSQHRGKRFAKEHCPKYLT